MSVLDEPLEESLRRWRTAGILTDEQVAQVLALEAAAPPPVPPAAQPPVAPAAPSVVGRPAAAPPPPVPAPRSTLVVEVVAYLGAALMASAVVGVVGREWADLGRVPQLVLLAVPTLAAVVAGAALRHRDGPLGRLASVLWLLALGGLAGFLVRLLVEGDAELSPSVATTVLALVAAAAVAAWWFRRDVLQLLAVVGTTTGLVAAVLDLVGADDPAVVGTVVAALGVGWFLAARVPVVRPAVAGTVGGLVTAYLGAQVVAADHELAGAAALVAGSAALMVLSVVDRSTLELLLGAFGLFTSLPRLAFMVLGDTLGAPVALLLCGAVLVGVAVRLARRRRVSHEALPSG